MVGVGSPTGLRAHGVVTAAFQPIFDRFRDIIVSGTEKLMKPDPAIYRLAIERFGIDPAGALFIDDVAANVAGA